MGLTYEQTHDLPVGELMDLVTINEIHYGRAKAKNDEQDDESIIPNVR